MVGVKNANTIQGHNVLNAFVDVYQSNTNKIANTKTTATAVIIAKILTTIVAVEFVLKVQLDFANQNNKKSKFCSFYFVFTRINSSGTVKRSESFVFSSG